MMGHFPRLLLLACLAAVAQAATVYYGGDILTMDGPSPAYVPALVVKGGKIAFMGSKEDAITNAGQGAKLIDLKGKTLMPGFIDAHGHLILASHSLLNANLEGVKSKDELINAMKEHGKKVPEPYWIEGMGYVASSVGGHPTVEDMDKISSTRPVFVQDKSGHQGVVNSVMLKLMNITKDSANPEGGVYYRKPGTTIPDGHIAETAVMAVMAKRPAMTPERTKMGLDQALQMWIENGMTTATELGAGLNGDDFDIVKMMVDNPKWLPVDLIVFAKVQAADQAINAAKGITAKYSGGASAKAEPRVDGDNRYINRVRGSGVKLWLDGSPPTALMSKPFVNEVDPSDKNYTGVQNDSPELLDATAAKYYDTNVQINAHAVGDKAIDNFINAFEKQMKVKGYPPKVSPVLQHAAFLRPDQLKRMKKLGIIPSYTMGAVYPFAKVYYQLYTNDVINMANPAQSTIKEGLVWTINHDYPAGGGPSLIEGVWNAVNRAVRGGGKDGIPEVTAPEQRVSAYDALKAITINAAIQHSEQKTKGSLAVGKLADMVVLDKNPLKVPPMDINKIVVTETIKEGKPIYTRTAFPPASSTAIAGKVTSDDDAHGAHPMPNKFTGNSISQQQAATLGNLLAASGNNNNSGRKRLSLRRMLWW